MIVRNLTVVGGGSAYVPGLVAALIHHRNSLHTLREVRLFDIDHEHLEVVSTLCHRLAQHACAGFRVSGHTVLAEALLEADVVLNSARPGGFECRRIDETLPLALDLPGQETVGPGGFFFALRSVPAALALAQKMTRVAPRALLLNYTNPTNIVSQALHDQSPVRCLGLCDQYDDDLASLGRALGAPVTTPQFGTSGLNHATWYSDLRFEAATLPQPLPDLEAPPGLDSEHALRFRLSVALAREEPGFWPNSYLPYYTHPDEFVALAGAEGPRTDAITKMLPRYFEHFRTEARRPEPKLEIHRGTSGFGDLAVRVLVALGHDEPSRLVLNVPNRGANALLRDDTVVECAVDLNAVHVVRHSAAHPEGWVDWIRRLERYQRSTAAAAAAGDRHALVDALAANPLVDSEVRARALIERAKPAYGERIPLLT